jgi:menaquinone-dependent protoporphyrinogen oxidase
VILAASVHAGQHETEMRKFVKGHVSELDSLPTAFLSVTLSEAGAEGATSATEEERAHFADDADGVIQAFFKETGWHPKQFKPVAGALIYSKYNFVIRLIMKRIAKKVGADTDLRRFPKVTHACSPKVVHPD